MRFGSTMKFIGFSIESDPIEIDPIEIVADFLLKGNAANWIVKFFHSTGADSIEKLISFIVDSNRRFQSSLTPLRIRMINISSIK